MKKLGIRKELRIFLPVVLLVGAIGLTESYVIGTIEGGKDFELRVEDIFLVILGLVWIGNSILAKIKKIEQPPLFLPIVAWLGIGFLGTFTNMLSQNIGFQRGSLFFLKEVEFFFIYFYLFYHLRSRQAIEWILKIWIGIGVLHITWIMYQIVSGWKITYYYSYTTFIEPEGTSPGGGFLLLIFLAPDNQQDNTR